MMKIRRWNGTRWVPYEKGEKVPDTAPLLDTEYWAQFERQVKEEWGDESERDERRGS